MYKETPKDVIQKVLPSHLKLHLYTQHVSTRRLRYTPVRPSLPPKASPTLSPLISAFPYKPQSTRMDMLAQRERVA